MALNVLHLPSAQFFREGGGGSTLKYKRGRARCGDFLHPPKVGAAAGGVNCSSIRRGSGWIWDGLGFDWSITMGTFAAILGFWCSSPRPWKTYWTDWVFGVKAVDIIGWNLTAVTRHGSHFSEEVWAGTMRLVDPEACSTK